MSKDIVDTEYVGVRFPRQVLDKIDERTAMTGEKRQDVIKKIVTSELFPGVCRWQTDTGLSRE